MPTTMVTDVAAEQPRCVVAVLQSHREEVGISDDGGLSSGVRSAVRERVSDRPESEGSTARVEYVLEHGVGHVLPSNVTVTHARQTLSYGSRPCTRNRKGPNSTKWRPRCNGLPRRNS